MKLTRLNNQKGFTLVQAVFILVVLGLLGMVMVRLIGVQSSTGVMALQGARAYHAARSGLEWGAARAVNGNCNSSGQMNIEGFNVIVACSSLEISEGSYNYQVFTIQSQATFGQYGSSDYISRTIQMRVGSYDVE